MTMRLLLWLQKLGKAVIHVSTQVRSKNYWDGSKIGGKSAQYLAKLNVPSLNFIVMGVQYRNWRIEKSMKGNWPNLHEPNTGNTAIILGTMHVDSIDMQKSVQQMEKFISICQFKWFIKNNRTMLIANRNVTIFCSWIRKLNILQFYPQQLYIKIYQSTEKGKVQMEALICVK